MPSRNKQVKSEIRIAKVDDELLMNGNYEDDWTSTGLPDDFRSSVDLPTAVGRQLNRLLVVEKSTQRMLPKSAPSASVNFDGVQKPVSGQGLPQQNQACVSVYVPVIWQGKPLMPTTPSRARRWIRERKATPFWANGIFCVRLNQQPSSEQVQGIVMGIDPGSKKEGFTVKSKVHTYINIQADAVTWVKDAVEVRRNMRRARRYRKTPCRQNRMNRAKGGLSPSTKARWQWKLRIINWLRRVYPISDYVVEDIKAWTKGKRSWDRSFSPLEVGKNWFYGQISQLGRLHLVQGYQTKGMRDLFGFKKLGTKLANDFYAHCVDSWVIAQHIVGGVLDNIRMLYISPIQLHRRQLHYLKPSKGGVRKPYGSTRSMGLKRGSLVKHPKYGLVYIGGTSNGKISLHDIQTGKRLSQRIDSEECKFLKFNSFRGTNNNEENQ